MAVTVHISDTIRSIAHKLPKRIVVDPPEATTLKQLASEVGIPTILIAFSIVNNEKIGLDQVISNPSEVHFMGTMAGG